MAMCFTDDHFDTTALVPIPFPFGYLKRSKETSLRISKCMFDYDTVLASWEKEWETDGSYFDLNFG